LNDIFFLTISGRNGASSRYRVYQLLPFLQENGYEVHVIPNLRVKSGIAGYLYTSKEEKECIEAASKTDFIFIQKKLFSVCFLNRLNSLGKKIIFDLDDSIFTSPKGDWSFITKMKVLRRLRKTVNISAAVITGNEFLKNRMTLEGAKRVEVLPTVIDLTRYRTKTASVSKQVVLGWIGSSVNHVYLDSLAGVLPAIAKEAVELKLLVISDKDYAMSGIEVENLRWSEATEIDDLLKVDIGLMPLTDNTWTKGKCALKALQYMACGIPAVCSAVGANKEIIEDGVDGFLARDDAGWLQALRALILHPEYRNTIGMAARDKVEKKYSLDSVAKKYINLLNSI